MACDQFASFCPSASQVIFQQRPDGRHYGPIDDSCITFKRTMEVSSWPIAPFPQNGVSAVASFSGKTQLSDLRLNSGDPRETLCGSIYFCARFA
jgi:hypothetical protein